MLQYLLCLTFAALGAAGTLQHECAPGGHCPSGATSNEHLVLVQLRAVQVHTSSKSGEKVWKTPGLHVTHLHFPLEGARATALLEGTQAQEQKGGGKGLDANGFCFDLMEGIPIAEKLGNVIEDHCVHSKVLGDADGTQVDVCSPFQLDAGSYCVEGSLTDMLETFVMLNTNIVKAPWAKGDLLEGRIIFAHAPSDGNFDKAEVSSQIAQVALAEGPGTMLVVASELYVLSKAALGKIGGDEASVFRLGPGWTGKIADACKPNKGLGMCWGHPKDIKIIDYGKKIFR